MLFGKTLTEHVSPTACPELTYIIIVIIINVF